MLGHDLVRHPERASRLLGYLGQESTALDELTVALAVETTGRLRGLGVREARAERDAVLGELGLADIAGRPLKKLSGGQRRLACFATVLIGERPLLVLDEPTTGMDPVARRAVWAAVDRRRGRAGRHGGAGDAQRPGGRERARPGRGDRPGPRHRLRHARRAEGHGGGGGPAGTGVARPACRWTSPRSPTCRPPRMSPAAAGPCGCPPTGPAPPSATVTAGPAFAALDDFTLATPSLEDVYLALGGRAEGLVKA